MRRPIVVGLTGGIGSGKSTAARILRKLGADGICLDESARKLLGTAGIRQEVVREFGKGVLGNDGTIDRKKLAQVAFSSRRNIRKLEAVIHPAVIMETIRRLNRAPAGKVFVIDAPLILESGMHHLCDFLIFIDADGGTRLKRAERAHGWDAEEVRRRQRFQKPLAVKKRAADFLVTNNGGMEELKKQLREILKKVKDKR